MFPPEQREVIVDAILAVVVSGDGADRLSILATGLQSGLNDLRIYCQNHRVKDVAAENKLLMTTVIDANIKNYSQRFFAEAVAAQRLGP